MKVGFAPLWCAALLTGCAGDYDLDGTLDGDQVFPPIMVVGPPLLDFGLLGEEESGVQPFTIRNDGAAPLSVHKISIQGSTRFSLVDPTQGQQFLEYGETASIQVEYHPASIPDDAQVLIEGDDPNLPQAVVHLTGNLAAPRVEIDPDPLDFGPMPPNCVEEATVLVKSVGSLPLEVNDVAFIGDYFSMPVSFEPVTLPPGEATPVGIGFAPLELGPFFGTLQVDSNDPRGAVESEIAGRGANPATCDGIMEGEISFVVQHGLADVSFVLDTTCSMSGTANAVAAEFSNIAQEVNATIPDLTFGVATYEDYNYGGFGAGPDKPFRLNIRQTPDVAAVAGLLSAGVAIHGGSDGPESTIEALYQVATGKGYDQNCNSVYDQADDVQPFLAAPTDAFGGNAAGIGGAPGDGIGDIGGLGYREEVLPIVVYATDAPFRDTDDSDPSPGGCVQDAGRYAAAAALAEINAALIGVAVGNGPMDEMLLLAALTGSLGDMNGDGRTEPAVVTWQAGSAAFRRTVVDAIVGFVESATFDKVALEWNDPLGLIIDVEPPAYFDVPAGTPVSFTYWVDGTIVSEGTPGAVEIEMDLIADDSVILQEASIFIKP